jgi:hypothetical protein
MKKLIPTLFVIISSITIYAYQHKPKSVSKK